MFENIFFNTNQFKTNKHIKMDQVTITTQVTDAVQVNVSTQTEQVTDANQVTDVNQVTDANQVTDTNQVTDAARSKNPRTVYLCEPLESTITNANRIIALTFSYNENGDISYGASIFRRRNPSDPFTKRSIRNTSLARYTDSPVHINMKNFNITKFKVNFTKPKDESSPKNVNKNKNENMPNFEDVVKTARKAMFTHGVNQRNQHS